MLRRVLPAAVAAAAAAMLAFRPIYEPDLWWHLAHGRENAAGHIVRANVFSFTYPDYRQHFTSWLFDTLTYAAVTAFGATGIQLLQTLLVGLAFWLLYRSCRVRAPAWSASAVLVIGFFVIEPRAIPRPHLVSFAAMAACGWLVERAAARRSAAPLYGAVPIVALWSNLHVECVFGVLMVAVFAGAELVRPAALTRADAFRALGAAAACGLATIANPYGWGLIRYLYENLSVPGILSIAELRRPYLPDYRAFYLYVGLLGVLLVVQPRRIRLWEAMMSLVFASLGAMHLRETPLVLLATAPIAADRLSALETRGLDRRAILITALCAALAVSRIPPRVFFTTFVAGSAAVEPPQFFSRAAVDFIRASRLEGPVFNSHNLGGYLAWTTYPEVRTFQDSRLQAYPPEHFRAIIDASRSQDAWNALVSGVDWAVLSVPRPNQLSGAGRFPGSEWASVFKDEAIEVVVRRTGKYGGLTR